MGELCPSLGFGEGRSDCGDYDRGRDVGGLCAAVEAEGGAVSSEAEPGTPEEQWL